MYISAMQANFIDQLAQIVYTPEGVQKAHQYMAQRGLDSTKWAFPPTVSGDNPNTFVEFRGKYPLHVFTECLYFPIEAPESVTRPEGTLPILAGFDVRYVGQNPNRTRFQKFKRDAEAVMLYGFTQYTRNPQWPLMVVEGVVDAESINALNLPVNVVAPLTAMSQEGFVASLTAMSNNIWMAYDNDDKGRKAIKQIWEILDKDPEAIQCFNLFNYQGKDINEALLTKGREYLIQQVTDQVLSYVPPEENRDTGEELLERLGKVELSI